MNRAVLDRIGIVIAVLALAGAAAFTFAPSSAVGAKCGNWLAPEWDEDKVRDLVESYGELADQNLDRDIAGQAVGSMQFLVQVQTECEDKLGVRRTLTFVTLGLGLVIPLALLYVGAAIRRQEGDAA